MIKTNELQRLKNLFEKSFSDIIRINYVTLKLTREG